MKNLLLNVGDIIKIGAKCAIKTFLPEGCIIVLIKGYFEYDNGLWEETQSAPSIWNKENKEFDSIYHLFGNNLEDFLDSKIIGKMAEDFTIDEDFNMFI